MNCLYRANIGASAAIGASFRIDLIDITFGDSFYGTLIDTGSAGCAIIIDFVSHDLLFYVPCTRQVSIIMFGANIGIFLIFKAVKILTTNYCFDF